MAMSAADHETGLSAEAEKVLVEIPRNGCDAYWISEAVLTELLEAELVQVWNDDGSWMIGPL